MPNVDITRELTPRLQQLMLLNSKIFNDNYNNDNDLIYNNRFINNDQRSEYTKTAVNQRSLLKISGLSDSFLSSFDSSSQIKKTCYKVLI